MAAKKTSKTKKSPEEEKKPEQPSVVFLDEKANKPVSLILMGVIAVVMGFISKTPIMAQTIFSTPADFMVIFGILGIIVGLIMNYQKQHSSDSKGTKKSK